MQRVSPPSPHSSLQFAELMGEGETLVDHPDLIDVMVAGGEEPGKDPAPHVPAKEYSRRSVGVERADVELVEGIRAGDESAWNGLVQRYTGRLWATARAQGLSAELAADVVQEIADLLGRPIGGLGAQRARISTNCGTSPMPPDVSAGTGRTLLLGRDKEDR